jgi:hypothetical protein
VCDGGNGATSLISTTPEAAGANCANGGVRIDFGIDDDASGTLDAGEVDGSAFVCDGSDGGTTTVQGLVTNANFDSDLTGWTLANNPTNSVDTVSTFTRLASGVVQNQPSSGPSARVLFQDFTVPANVTSAKFQMLFAQNNGSALDPENVLTIQSDPGDVNGGGAQNAFRVDLVDPTGAQFQEPILFTLFAPVDAVAGVDGTLTLVEVESPELLAFLQAQQGNTLRLRFGQVESTFPWTLQLDEVQLTVSAN